MISRWCTACKYTDALGCRGFHTQCIYQCEIQTSVCDEVRLWIIIWESASASKCDFITLVSDSSCCWAHLLWPENSPKGLREIILHLSISFSAAFQRLYCLTGFAVNVLARMSALSSSSSPAVADNRFGRLKLCPFEAAVVTKAPSDMWVVKQQFDQTALQSQFT